jgi:hypothetical protein
MGKLFNLVAGGGLGAALAFWRDLQRPMFVAMGWPLLILAAGNLRFARLERQIAELQKAEVACVRHVKDSMRAGRPALGS